MIAIRNLGKNTLRELRKKVGEMELSFGLQPPQEVPASEGEEVPASEGEEVSASEGEEVSASEGKEVSASEGKEP